jgi:predicted AAA+ superfamily ATPase
MLPRRAAPTLRRLARYYSVVAITGPRQSGKTTLARATFPRKPYASLEDLDTREFAERDPRGFLAQYPAGAVLDEAQRCPALFSYLQTVVDRAKRPGQFVVTGSQQFGLFANITQTLAGRVGLVHLLPFTLGEAAQGRPPKTLEDLLWRGLYPPVHDRNIPADVWYADYMVTYVERDVRQMVNVRDLATFRRFVRMCATRTGQVVNLASLGADCGITHNTSKAWLSVLEASYLVHLLPPYHRNFGKRLIKAPKLYFCDPGLAAWLAGIREAGSLAIHPMRGALFETWVVGELLKAGYNRGRTAALHFWRDSGGTEIDVVAEPGTVLVPVEVKSGATLVPDYFAGLTRFRGLSGAREGILIYGGADSQRRSGTRVFAWRDVERAAAMVV